MQQVAIGFIVSNVFCLLASVLILYQCILHPKRIRYCIFIFCLLNLPGSIINTLNFVGETNDFANSLAYLICTLLMLALHFWMNLDVGRKLRIGGIEWKHFLVIIGMIFLVGSCICLIVQIILLSVHHEPFPRRPVFITGVCFAIICDGSTFTYTFSSLIHWRANRINEGQSRTTALGAWYMIIQFIWYSIYGVLYIWFFAANSWTYFNAMLVFDYVLRFLLCLMYTWPPPNRPIDFMTRKLFATEDGLPNCRSTDYYLRDMADDSGFRNRTSLDHHAKEGSPFSNRR